MRRRRPSRATLRNKLFLYSAEYLLGCAHNQRCRTDKQSIPPSNREGAVAGSRDETLIVYAPTEERQ